MSVKDSIIWRKTVKKYIKDKPIKNTDLETIIEAGRLAPSSLGLEVTKIVVINNKKLKSEIAEKVMSGSNSEKVLSASSVIFLLGTNSSYLTSKDFLELRLKRMINDPNDLKKGVHKYQSFLKQKDELKGYVAEQVHITVSFMTLQAAELKIGTTIMGGFNPEESDKFLEKHKLVDKSKYNTVLILALGYYDEKDEKNALPRIRISFDEFAKIIK